MENIKLNELSDYPFARLENLIKDITPQKNIIKLFIGEPTFKMPEFAIQDKQTYANLWNKYPSVSGTTEWQDALYNWLTNRFNTQKTQLNPRECLIPGNGSKELIYSATHYLNVNNSNNPNKNLFIVPNPFYQPYKGASILNGGKVKLLNAKKENNFLPDYTELSKDELKATRGFFLCNPSNPQGSCADINYLINLIKLSREYNFYLLVDECYSDIYHTKERPVGIIDAIAQTGGSFKNIIIFNTLSKRSSAAGLRSGAIITNQGTARDIKKLKTYSGGSPSLFTLKVSSLLWQDQDHAVKIREQYSSYIALSNQILGDYKGYYQPQGAFFLWLNVKDGEEFTKKLYKDQGVIVIPGSYYAENNNNENPGQKYVRVSLVESKENIEEGLKRIKQCLSEFL